MSEEPKKGGWPADRIEMWPVARLTPYAGNVKQHPPAQVAQIVRSIEVFGFTAPVLVDESGEIIAGHGRVLAANALELSEVPVVVARGWSEDMRRAYRIADNKLTENGAWDEAALVEEFRALEASEFDLGLTGFSGDELSALFESVEPGERRREPPPPPEPPAKPVTRHGDIWVLGAHRLACCDSREPVEVAALMAGAKAVLLHADPPYGMGKEADGVANDNLYEGKLDAFQLAWWRACRPHLDPNASAYIWGNARDLWRLWWRAGLVDLEPVTLRNEIVWDKGSIAGMRSGDLTQYPEASERCLFFQLGRHVFLINRTKDDYWDGWEDLRVWLCGERDAAGFTPKDVARICENHMYGHWFGKSQWAFISQDNYEKLAQAASGKAFTRPYADVLEEYRAAARIWSGEVRGPRAEDFRAGRPFFDNTHDTMRDVWDFPRVSGEEREGHATPKPVVMMERAIRSSAREGQSVIEPFCGSGSTLIACERTGRRCFTAELEPAWVDVTIERWESLTGKTAVLERTGETYQRLKDARA